MKTKTIFIVLSLILVALPLGSQAADKGPLTYYWGPDGTISNESNNNAKRMRQIAMKNSYVTLWIVLNYPINLYLDQMTTEEIEAQIAAVAEGFAEILDPMIRKNNAWLPKAGPLIRGPSSNVRVNRKGLRQLLKDERILQISAFE